MVRTNLKRCELKKLDEIARNDGRSRSGLISTVLRKLIDSFEQRNNEETQS